MEVVAAGYLLQPDERTGYRRWGNLEIDQAVKKSEQYRALLVNYLKEQPEIKELDDLFTKKEPQAFMVTRRVTGILPITGILHLPKRLQRDIVGNYPRTEEFCFAYDGVILLIGAISSEAKHMGGFPAARDQIKGLFDKAVPTKMVPPSVTRSSFLIFNGGKSIEKITKRSTKLTLSTTRSIKEALELIHRLSHGELSKFYTLCDLASEVEESASAINRDGTGLILNLKAMFALKFYNVLQRRKRSTEILGLIASLLDSMSFHDRLNSELERETLKLESDLESDDRLKEFMNKTDWEDFASSDVELSDTTLSIIEFAKDEMQRSSLVSSTLWAGVVGAIAGSVLTLVLTRFL